MSECVAWRLCSLLSESSWVTQRKRSILGSSWASAPGYGSPLAAVFSLPHPTGGAARGTRPTSCEHIHQACHMTNSRSDWSTAGVGVRGHGRGHSASSAGSLYFHWTVWPVRTHLKIHRDVSHVATQLSSPLGEDDILIDPSEVLGRRLDFQLILDQCCGVRWIKETRNRGVQIG